MTQTNQNALKQSFPESLRSCLLEEFSIQEMKQWIDPLDIGLDSEGVVTVQFPHSLFAGWFDESIRDRFETRLATCLAPGARLVYENAPGAGAGGTGDTEHAGSTVEQPFGKRFTFAGYLVNNKNFFPVESAREVARQGHEPCNPFVITGESGSGKTHLLRAMANTLARQVPSTSIYLGSPLILQQYVERHCDGDWALGRYRIERHAFLFLDDCQQLDGLPELQHEMAILVDAFLEQEKQVACARIGGVNSTMGQHLASRLSSGLIVNLKQADMSIRLKYVQRVTRSKGLRLSKEQSLTLARRFTDIRGLQGVLLKIGVFRNLVHRDLTDKDFEHILTHSESMSGEELSPEALMCEAAEFFSVSVDDLRSKTRARKVVEARQATMFVMRQLLGCSYPVLGRMFGGRDHSTVMHGVKKMEEIYRSGGEMKASLTELKKRCRALEKGGV